MSFWLPAFACILAATSGSCSRVRELSHHARVREVVPSEVELGDRVAILGEGFPPGRPARITFRGTLNRPGEQPLRGAEVIVPGSAVATTRLEFALTDDTQSLFCGPGDRAAHTTFVGDVEVAFASAPNGESPVAGYLENVTFDVRPNASASTRERAHEGELVLSWLGVKAVASTSGLIVEQVEAGSRAQGLGIVSGDMVTGFDGVRVASVSDIVPPPGERSATIDVLEGAAGARKKRIVALDGLRRPSPTDLVGAVLCVLSALGIVWLFGSPTLPNVASALQRVVSRVRGRVRGVPSHESFGHAAFTIARHALPPASAAAIGDVVAGSLLMLPPFGQYVVALRLDVWLLFVAALACLAAVAFAARASWWQGVRAAAEVAWRHAPAAVAVASSILLTGSLSLHEIGESQGGWPWDWAAFRSPVSLLALCLLVACTRIDPGDDAVLSPLALTLEGSATPPPARGSAWQEAACRMHRIIVAGLASVLFLGGWRLPGIPSAEQTESPVLELAGAAWLFAKTWSLVVLMAWIRWSLCRREVGRNTLASAITAALWSVAAAASTAAWIGWAPPPSLQRMLSALLSVAVAVAGLALVQRLHHGLTSAEGDAHLSPFL
jgi:NADH-quinone oxidoreductase subunit H